MTEKQALPAIAAKIVAAIEDKKGLDIQVMDVRGQCAFTDAFVLATGKTDRQLKAIAQAVSTVAHEYGLPAKIEGLDAMEWLLVDLDEVVVHLFLPDVRETIQLDRLWERSAQMQTPDTETNHES